MKFLGSSSIFAFAAPSRWFLSIALLLLLVGCSTGWLRPNTSVQQVQNDRTECQLSALEKYPPRIVRAHTLESGEPRFDQDASQILRGEEEKYCMRQRGYTFGLAR